MKLAHSALINAIHGIDEVCKNVRKELLFLFYLKCMNADVDACVREKEEGTPRSKGGGDGGTCQFIVFDVLCSSCYCHFC